MREWKKTYLRDLIVIKNGKDHKKLKNGQYPVYGSGGIMRYADSYLYDQESVLLPRKGTLNNIQFVTEPFWTVDTCYYTVVNRDKVLPYFLYCCLYKMDIQSLNTGSAVPSMTFEKYYSIEVPLPPLSTQHRIATILSRYDSLIENYQKQIKLLEEAAQRLYKEWFVDLRFPGHENTNILDGVPEGWEMKKVGEIAIITAGGDKPDVVTEEQTTECQVPIYSNGTTKEGLYGYTNKSSNTAGSITVSARGSIGFACLRMHDYFSIVRLISIKPQNNVDLMYLFQFTKVHTFMSNGAAQQQLTVPMVKAIDVVYPAESLLEAFENVVLPLYKKVQSLQSQLRLLTESRDRLLPKLMSGEIEV